MDASSPRFPDLLEHLERTTRLTPAEAERVVAEVINYFSESLEGFVVRRHAELQSEAFRGVYTILEAARGCRSTK